MDPPNGPSGGEETLTGALVTDSGSIFLANRAKDAYQALGITKHEIERAKPWQNYGETSLGIQKRMVAWHFAKARGWLELVEAWERCCSHASTRTIVWLTLQGPSRPRTRSSARSS